MYENEVKKLQEMIDDSSNIVFFGGAGVSTESNIPDFRSADGLYRQSYKYSPEQIVSHSFFVHHTEAFYEFYKEKMMFLSAQPNPAHRKLAELEAKGKLTAVVTQNIDGLHQAAGSKKVYELHGSVLRNYCMKCNRFYDADFIRKCSGIPRCTCGGIIKPDVVLYQEGLSDSVINGAVTSIKEADLLIVGGTSLNVYPAAGLIKYRSKDCFLLLINLTETPADSFADMVIHDSIGKIMGSIMSG